MLSASWWGNGSPRRWRLAGVRARPASLGLRHCPDSYGRLQSRIFPNGRKSEGATPRAGRSSSECKLLFCRKNQWWYGRNKPLLTSCQPRIQRVYKGWRREAFVVTRKRKILLYGPNLTLVGKRIANEVARPNRSGKSLVVRCLSPYMIGTAANRLPAGNLDIILGVPQRLYARLPCI